MNAVHVLVAATLLLVSPSPAVAGKPRSFGPFELRTGDLGVHRAVQAYLDHPWKWLSPGFSRHVSFEPRLGLLRPSLARWKRLSGKQPRGLASSVPLTRFAGKTIDAEKFVRSLGAQLGTLWTPRPDSAESVCQLIFMTGEHAGGLGSLRLRLTDASAKVPTLAVATVIGATVSYGAGARRELERPHSIVVEQGRVTLISPAGLPDGVAGPIRVWKIFKEGFYVKTPAGTPYPAIGMDIDILERTNKVTVMPWVGERPVLTPDF